MNLAACTELRRSKRSHERQRIINSLKLVRQLADMTSKNKLITYETPMYYRTQKDMNKHVGFSRKSGTGYAHSLIGSQNIWIYNNIINIYTHEN